MTREGGGKKCLKIAQPAAEEKKRIRLILLIHFQGGKGLVCLHPRARSQEEKKGKSKRRSSSLSYSEKKEKTSTTKIHSSSRVPEKKGKDNYSHCQ